MRDHSNLSHRNLSSRGFDPGESWGSIKPIPRDGRTHDPIAEYPAACAPASGPSRNQQGNKMFLSSFGVTLSSLRRIDPSGQGSPPERRPVTPPLRCAQWLTTWPRLSHRRQL